MSNIFDKEEKDHNLDETVRKKVSGRRDEESKGGLFSIKNILIAISIVFVLLVVSFVITKNIMGPIIIVLLALIIIAVYYSMYVYFAPRKTIFSGIREATAKAIVVGTKEDPKFIRAVISYEGHDLDEKWNVVPEGRGYKRSSFVKFIESLFPGLVLIGVPGMHWIWEYEFDWTSSEQEGKLKTKKKTLDYIYLKRDIYISILKGAEVGITFVPVDIQINITVMIINPYKALFRVENWLEYIINIVKVVLRDFVGQIGQELTPEEQETLKEIKDLKTRERVENEFRLKKAHTVFVSGKKDLGDEIYKKLENSGDLKEFRNEIGVEVLKVQTPDINFGAFQELALAQFRAHQEGEAKVIQETKRGEAYEAYRRREAIADVGYIKETFGTILSFGDKGVLLETLKALKATDKVITLGSIQNITDQFLGIKPDAVADLIKQATGKNLSEITSTDIEKILEALKNKK
jgi:hypothetical protein